MSKRLEVMLRIVSPLLGESANIGSAIVCVFSGNEYKASLGNFKLFNSALPILRTSSDIGSLSPNSSNEIEIDFPSDASSILNLTIAGKVYKPSRSPDDLQPGEYKLDFNNLKIIVRLFPDGVS